MPAPRYLGSWYPSTASMALARHDLRKKSGPGELDGWWLTAKQKREISSKLAGLPVTYEHSGIMDVAWEDAGSMHQHLISASQKTNDVLKRPVGTVLSAGDGGTATFELDEPSGLVAKMVDGGMLRYLSLTHRTEPDGSLTPLEVTLTTEPARPGAAISGRYVYPHQPRGGHAGNIAAMSAPAASAAAPAAEPVAAAVAAEPAAAAPAAAAVVPAVAEPANPGATAHDALERFAQQHPAEAETVRNVISNLSTEADSFREQMEAAKKAVAATPASTAAAQNNLGWEIIQSYIKDLWNKFPEGERQAYGYNPAELEQLASAPEHEKVQTMNRAIMACNNRMMMMAAEGATTGMKRRRTETPAAAAAPAAVAPVAAAPVPAPAAAAPAAATPAASGRSLRDVLMQKFSPTM